jgi:ribulose kinase
MKILVTAILSLSFIFSSLTPTKADVRGSDIVAGAVILGLGIAAATAIEREQRRKKARRYYYEEPRYRHPNKYREWQNHRHDYRRYREF